MLELKNMKENGDKFEFLDRVELVSKDKFKFTFDNVKALAPQDTIIYVLDTSIKDFEREKELDSCGFGKENIINLDHHFNDQKFMKHVSTTNLAMEYVKKNEPIDLEKSKIVLNHTDCDSVLSMAILCGYLKPEQKYGEAAIAADHTGQANEIADLLQGIEYERDLEFSLRNLKLLEAGKPLESKAQELLKKRHLNRAAAEEASKEFKSSESGKIAYVFLDRKIDAALFPSLLPNAELIVTFAHKINDHGLKIVEAKTRLGLAAPEGLNLKDIMPKADPYWGGRWNAGSNGRSAEGTKKPMEEYVAEIDKYLS